MKKVLLLATVLFALLIVLIVVATNTARIPKPLEELSDFPGGDKVGHFLLFGFLGYLLNQSALWYFPERSPAWVVFTTSLLLALLVGLEEWSQSLFPARTMSLIDLVASFAGVAVFALLAFWTKPG